MEEAKNGTKEQEDGNVKVLEKTENSSNDVTKQVEQQKKTQEEIKQKEPKQGSQKETGEQQEVEPEKNVKTKLQEEAKKEELTITITKPKEHLKSNIILIIIGILVVVIAIFSTIFAVINIRNDKVIKGISIGNIDVSNMTREEAKKTLDEIYSAKSENQIYLTYEDFETAITYKALEVEYQIDDAIKQAYDTGRAGNIFKDNIDILKTWTYGKNIEIETTIDNEMISQISQNINNSIKDAVVQVSYYIENEKLIITSGKEGLKVNEKQLLEEIYNVLRTDTEDEQNIIIPIITAEPEKIDIEKIHQEIYKEVQNAYYIKEPFTIYPEQDGIDFDIESAKIALLEEKAEYEIPLIITKPTKTIKEIGTEAFPDLLVTFSTNYVASNVNRTTNLRLAAQKINGTVLLPNEEFSYNKVVGERTIQAGYKEAAVYSNGEVVNGLGGGICQISSTLYNAVVMANLQVTERRNHQFVTSYLPAGKDATVVWGSQDFKFVNTRSYPVRIEATVSGGVATISIWGVKEDVEYEISIETKKIATIAYTTQYIQDPSLSAGTEVVKQAGSNGRKVEAYKVVKLNGQVVAITLLSKDTYNAMKRIVNVGTGTQE